MYLSGCGCGVFARMIDHIDYIQAKRLKSNMKKQREQNMKKKKGKRSSSFELIKQTK